MTDETIVDDEDIYTIGSKVVEMAERIQPMNKVVPGTAAKWSFDMDGTQFEVVVRVAALAGAAA